MIRCVRLWTGEDQNSHFEEGVLDLEQGQRGDLLSGKLAAATVSFQETSSGGAFAWHTAPARQLVITLSGTLDFQTREGEHFLLHPGDILLAEDHADEASCRHERVLVHGHERIDGHRHRAEQNAFRHSSLFLQ